MKNIESLIPSVIAENHYKFVNWSLNRPSKELVAKKPEFMAFAQDKDELIFPIKILPENHYPLL